MENLINTLSKKWKGYGTFLISIEHEGETFFKTTHNTMAIDAAFDDCYDDNDNSERYFKSQEEAQIELVNEILIQNDIEL
jgi:phage-related protein